MLFASAVLMKRLDLMNLFILGNGFDMANNMETEYCHFRKFLIDNYNFLKETSFVFPEHMVDNHGDDIPNQTNALKIIFSLLEELQNNEENIESEKLWKNFEKYLGQFKYSEWFGFLREEEDEFRFAHNSEDLASELKMSIPLINNFFAKWVNQIKLKPAKMEFVELFNEEALFLTFNYTETLEKTYRIIPNNICHIHGKIGEKLIIGHNEDYNSYEELTYGGISGCYLSEINEMLRKDVRSHYNNKIHFFNQIYNSNITDIYSIGFSFSNVDLYYIEQICANFNTENIKWHLTQYDENNGYNDGYRADILSCGYKGEWGNLI